MVLLDFSGACLTMLTGIISAINFGTALNFSQSRVMLVRSLVEDCVSELVILFCIKLVYGFVRQPTGFSVRSVALYSVDY